MPSHSFPTSLGWMALAWQDDQLARLAFGHPSAAAAIAGLEGTGDWTATNRRDLPPWVADLAERLAAYAAGEAVSLADVPLDLSHLTPFQRKVALACRRIPRGKTRTYGELAAIAGAPGAARAVGSVMSHNRFPLIIPCHRVLGAAGSLGGYSAPDGLATKRRLLALEGWEPRGKRMSKAGR
ncbi:MAG: methylated-DNA--[protein]-cysteine S-methyltransferase [Pirellulaceae bacterium]|nr:methylated-DNA--[protein]-cysteine S-methyltransferase [Pirellulaceae bacterium]